MDLEPDEACKFKDGTCVHDQFTALDNAALDHLEVKAMMGYMLMDDWVEGRQDKYEVVGCVPGDSRPSSLVRFCQSDDQLFVGKFYLRSRSKKVQVNFQHAHIDEWHNEASTLLELKNCEHVVKICDSGFTSIGKIPFIMLERLGQCLENYTTLNGYCRFSNLSALLTFREIVRGLKEIHSYGFVSRDVKLANVCMKVDEHGSPRTVKLIDFGHSAKFHESDYRELQKPGKDEQRQGFVGTRIFASRAAHMGLKQVPYDDLESLFYSCVCLFGSNLPWTYMDRVKPFPKKDFWAYDSHGYRLPLDKIYKYIRGLKRSQPLNHDGLLELLDALIGEAGSHVEYGKSEEVYPMIVLRDENHNADLYSIRL